MYTHVGGDQDSLLGLAVMQACGAQVLPGAPNNANVWRLGYEITGCSRHNNDRADLWGPAYSCGSQQLGPACCFFFCSSEVAQACGDQVASAHRQWSKLLETEPEPGCVPGGSHNGALPKATAAHRLSLPAAQGLCVT